MFVLSMKTTRPRLAAFGAVFCVLLAVVLGTKALSRGTVPVTAPAAANPAAYLQSFGYEVEPQWTALQEITVPVEEDPAFAAYNAVLQAAGYDLSAYQGERVKCYTYKVLNYPGEEGVEARVYTYKDRVVAGDIASAAADGFCKGLTPLTPDMTENEGETHGTTG